MLGLALSQARHEKVWQPAIAATWLMIMRDGVAAKSWDCEGRNRSATTNCTTGRYQDRRIAPTVVVQPALIQSQPRIGDIVFASRSGETPIVGYRKMWLRIAKLGGSSSRLTPHVLRHSFASLAADLGYNEPTIASLLGHKTHSITSRYMHSADAVLLAAADAVANATMKLMESRIRRNPSCGISSEMDQSCGTESPLYRCFRDTWIRQISDIADHICHQSRGTNLPLYRCFRPTGRMADFCLLASSNLGRDQTTLPTRARHSSLQVRQCPQEFGGASLGGCLGEVHRYRQFWVLWRSRDVNHRMLRRWRW